MSCRSIVHWFKQSTTCLVSQVESFFLALQPNCKTLVIRATSILLNIQLCTLCVSYWHINKTFLMEDHANHTIGCLFIMMAQRALLSPSADLPQLRKFQRYKEDCNVSFHHRSQCHSHHHHLLHVLAVVPVQGITWYSVCKGYWHSWGPQGSLASESADFK